MGPTWALSTPDGPHVGPMNLAIWVASGGSWLDPVTLPFQLEKLQVTQLMVIKLALDLPNLKQIQSAVLL